MASIKISALPAATSIASADVVPIVQSGTTKQITQANLASSTWTNMTLVNPALGTPASGTLTNCTFPTNIKIASAGFSLDGAGSVLTTGLVGYTTVPYAGTITAWSIVADGSSPTCTIDVWKTATGTALPNVGNTIMGTKPALSIGNAIRSTTLTGWNPVAVTANDIIGFNLDAVTVATKLTFELEITKT